jgi:hypothetical protein
MKMKYILLKLAIKAVYFLALVVFSAGIGLLAAFVAPVALVFLPFHIGIDINELARIIFAAVSLFFIVMNFGRNQRAADNCCKFGPPMV